MEATVDKLESMFQKADADLDYLSRKLDSEFANDQEAQGAAVKGEKASPGKMLQKIAEIKKEYAEIVKEAEAIKTAQKEAMDFFRNELMMVCETLGRLQQNVGMEQAPPPEDMARVTEILGIDVPPGAGGDAGSEAAVNGEDDTTSDQTEQTQSKPATTDTTVTPQAVAPPQPTLSPLERRSDCAELIEIDETEFQTISALVRGRAKLSDVNHTYRILWTHFKEEGNTKALNPQEMHKMGLRVTGQTGEAKLKILRALKLLTLSNKGDVKLV